MRSTVLRAVLVILVMGVLVASASRWFEALGKAEAPLEKAEAFTETHMDDWMTAAPGGAWLLWGPRCLAILLGVVFLVQEFLRADKIRHGVLPPPDPQGPTVVMGVGQAVAWGVGFPLVVHFVGAILWRATHPNRPVGDLPLSVSVAIVVAALLPPALLAGLRRLRLGAGRLPRAGRALLEGFRFGCMALLVVVPAALAWGLALKARGVTLQVQETIQRFAQPTSPEDPWIITVFGAFVAPFTEEGVFRGLLYPSLRGRVPGGPLGAATVVALVFAGIHGSLTAFLPLFVLALFLCWVMERTNSLLACVVVHGFHNAVSLLPLIWRHAAGAAS